MVNKNRISESILSKYRSESIDFVRDYKDEIDNLVVVELQWPDFVEVDPSDEIRIIRHSYLMYGIGEDYINSAEEFDEIYEALCSAS